MLSLILIVLLKRVLPVPAGVISIFVFVADVTVLPSIVILSTVICGAFSLVLFTSTTVAPATLNLIILSFAPGVNSAVIFVLPSKSCTPFSTVQLDPSYPSKVFKSVLYLVFPAAAVGLWAVVPDGNFNAPVELKLISFAVPGCNVKSTLEAIVLPLILIESTTIDPVPFALNSKFALDAVLVIKYL